MKAIVCTRYGSPDVLQLQEIETPVPGDDEVLIKIHATSVTAAHTMMREGVPRFGRLFVGLTKPKNAIPGTDLSGEVVATGKNVERFRVGDQVFGVTDLGGGCYAEYACLPQDEVMAHKPTETSHAEAATILDGALTALHFLRDQAKIQPGQRVLINGASGGVGTAAVQIAKYFGAHVTGVCSTTNLEMVKSLGADEVIDYTRQDFAQTDQPYDIIFDAVGKSSFAHCKDALTPRGLYMTTVAGLPAMAQTLWTGLVGSKKVKFAAAGLRPAGDKQQDLLLLSELLEQGTIHSVIDRSYRLDQVSDAHRYVDTGRKKGTVAITVVDNATSRQHGRSQRAAIANSL